MERLGSEYPTDAQMEEIWEALETGDDSAVLEVLHKRQEERRAAKVATDKAEGDHTGSQNADG